MWNTNFLSTEYTRFNPKAFAHPKMATLSYCIDMNMYSSAQQMVKR